MSNIGTLTQDVARTGIQGLDDVLAGGFARNRLFLVEGEPGSGKTTLALQFLLEGVRAGETVHYVTLSETEEELRSIAASHGWNLDGLTLQELTPSEDELEPDEQATMFHAPEIELAATLRRVLDDVQRLKPTRVVFDSLSEMRLLAGHTLRYRRQILALKHYFARHQATVLLLDDLTADTNDKTVHSVANGVVRLEEMAPHYGSERRRLRVIKYRAQAFRGGYHDFTIKTGGVQVFPRLVAAEHRRPLSRGRFISGIEGLDTLLGGGVEEGSSTVLLGPPGSGKSIIGLQFVCEAIRRGGRAALFVFDEEIGLLFDRAKPLGFDLAALRDAGHLHIEQLDAAELSPGEFAHRVRATIQDPTVRTVVIDSLNGYQAAMPQENSLILHMHEILQFLNRHGVSTFLTVAQQGMMGDMRSPVDITYLADSVIMLRFFEARGSVKRAISVVKKRTGRHEATIREFWIDGGLHVGEPLTNFQGVLRGVPLILNDPATNALAKLE